MRFAMCSQARAGVTGRRFMARALRFQVVGRVKPLLRRLILPLKGHQASLLTALCIQLVGEVRPCTRIL